MNFLVNAAAAFPVPVQDATLTVSQLAVAGVIATAIVGLVLGIMTYIANHTRDIVKSEVKPLVARLDIVDARLDKMDDRFDKIDARLDKMDKRMDNMDKRMDRLEVKLDKVADDVGMLVQVVTRLVDGRARG